MTAPARISGSGRHSSIDDCYWTLDSAAPSPCDTCSQRAGCREECPLFLKYVRAATRTEGLRKYMAALAERDGTNHLPPLAERALKAAADIGAPFTAEDLVIAYQIRFGKLMLQKTAEEHLVALEKYGTAERCGGGLWQIRFTNHQPTTQE